MLIDCLCYQVRLPVNSRLLVVKCLGNWNLYMNFQLRRALCRQLLHCSRVNCIFSWKKEKGNWGFFVLGSGTSYTLPEDGCYKQGATQASFSGADYTIHECGLCLCIYFKTLPGNADLQPRLRALEPRGNESASLCWTAHASSGSQAWNDIWD